MPLNKENQQNHTLINFCASFHAFSYKVHIILPYPRRVEFSGEEVIALPLVYIASLFIYELRSR